MLDDVLLSIEAEPINSRPSSCRQMSRPIHYISDALHGLVYISNLWSPFNGMVETRKLRPQKRFCLTNFCQKKCYVFFFSFLSFFLFLFFFFFFFFLIKIEQCEKRFFNRVLVPFFPRFAANFVQYFSMATKKKKKKKKRAQRVYAAKGQMWVHILMHAGLWDKPLFIFFFSTLGIT